MTYAVLLRGINVGAHNRIKMAPLRESLTAAGFENVSTHIQSGNIRLDWDGDAESVGAAISAVLAEHGISKAKMSILTWSRLRELVESQPYKGFGDDHRRLALFMTSSLDSPRDLIGEHGVMTVVDAHPDVIFTAALKEATPGMKGIDTLEKIHRIPTTGRFWNVIEDWTRE